MRPLPLRFGVSPAPARAADVASRPPHRPRIILLVLIIFWFTTYASGAIGSPAHMWALLQDAQVRNADAPTLQHSYVTVRSLGAL